MAMAGSSVLLKSLEGCPCLCSVGGQVIQYGLLHRPKALAIDPRKNNDTSHGSMGAANGEKTGAMKFEGPWIGLFGKACRKLMALLISLSLPPCCWISQEQTPNSKLLIPRWIWPILGRNNYHQIKSMWQQKVLNLRVMFAIPDHDFPIFHC